MVGEFGGIGAFVTQWQPNKCHTYMKVATPAAEAAACAAAGFESAYQHIRASRFDEGLSAEC
jgi:hypothetical protein